MGGGVIFFSFIVSTRVLSGLTSLWVGGNLVPTYPRILVIHNPKIVRLGTVYADRQNQFDVRRAAGTGDEHEIVVRFRFSENLMQINSQRALVNNSKVDTRRKRD